MSEDQTTADTQQSVTETFTDTLPEDIRNEPSLKNFTNAGDLAKSYLHANRMVGSDKIAIPGKHSTDEDWQQVYSKLGRPEKSDGYEFNFEIPEENQQIINNFSDIAHKNGLTNNQANAVLDFYNQIQTDANQSAETLAQSNLVEKDTELRKEWGLNYDKNLSIADNVFKAHFAEGMNTLTLEDGTMLGNHPEFIKSLVALGKNFSEDQLTKENSPGISPADAQREIAKLQASEPYMNKNHPNHEMAVQEVAQLYKVQFGE
tara:strand:+ start:5352 stop:6134 length:783 start_codon:yes stop_codon:yes gene_type:complete